MRGACSLQVNLCMVNGASDTGGNVHARLVRGPDILFVSPKR